MKGKKVIIFFHLGLIIKFFLATMPLFLSVTIDAFIFTRTLYEKILRKRSVIER